MRQLWNCSTTNPSAAERFKSKLSNKQCAGPTNLTSREISSKPWAGKRCCSGQWRAVMMIRGTGAQGTAKSQSDVDELTWRVRVALAAELVTERRMFGGTTFMLNGNMLCWAGRSGLMVRVGREGEAAALTAPFTGPCLETGRPMGGICHGETPWDCRGREFGPLAGFCTGLCDRASSEGRSEGTYPQTQATAEIMSGAHRRYHLFGA